VLRKTLLPILILLTTHYYNCCASPLKAQFQLMLQQIKLKMLQGHFEDAYKLVKKLESKSLSSEQKNILQDIKQKLEQKLREIYQPIANKIIKLAKKDPQKALDLYLRLFVSCPLKKLKARVDKLIKSNVTEKLFHLNAASVASGKTITNEAQLKEAMADKFAKLIQKALLKKDFEKVKVLLKKLEFYNPKHPLVAELKNSIQTLIKVQKIWKNKFNSSPEELEKFARLIFIYHKIIKKYLFKSTEEMDKVYLFIASFLIKDGKIKKAKDTLKLCSKSTKHLSKWWALRFKIAWLEEDYGFILANAYDKPRFYTYFTAAFFKKYFMNFFITGLSLVNFFILGWINFRLIDATEDFTISKKLLNGELIYNLITNRIKKLIKTDPHKAFQLATALSLRLPYDKDIALLKAKAAENIHPSLAAKVYLELAEMFQEKKFFLYKAAIMFDKAKNYAEAAKLIPRVVGNLVDISDIWSSPTTVKVKIYKQKFKEFVKTAERLFWG